MSRYTLGAIPSPYDPRDYDVARFNGPASALALAPVWSFAGLLQPVRDQGSEGTCVGHALTSVMGYQQQTAGPAPDREVLSPRDAYEGARMLEPVPGGAEGAYPRAALKYAQRQGVCRDDRWPYIEHDRRQALAGAPESRSANRILTYARVPCTLQAIKEALHWHGPILATIAADEGFTATGGDGVVISRGLSLGAHAVTLVGWDDQRKAFHLRNSWGAAWGANGDAWLPYSWAVIEAWSCTPALDAPPPEIPWWERIFPWWKF